MILKDNQQGQLAVIAKSKKGNPSQIEGRPTWESSDPAIASITPSEDGLSATVKAEINLGDTTITVTAQVMIKGELTTRTKTAIVTVVAGDGEELDIIEGEVTDQLAA